MFDFSNYSDYDRWLDVFIEGPARPDALDRRNRRPPPVRKGGVSNEQILEVLEIETYNPSRTGQPGRSDADD